MKIPYKLFLILFIYLIPQFLIGKTLINDDLKNSLVEKLYQQSSSLRNVFRRFDVDGSGELSRQEFRQAVAKMGFDPNSKEVDEILDTNLFDFKRAQRDGPVEWKSIF